MRSIHSFRSVTALIGAIGFASVLGACDGGPGSSQPGADQSGESVTVALTTVPPSTLCIRITATPSSGSATVKSFIVTPGTTSANLQIGTLAPGDYMLTADAYKVACTSITGSGSWIADAVPVTVKSGVTATVTLTFRKNNPLSVNANFVNNVQGVWVNGPASYVLTDTGLLSAGSSPWNTRRTFSSFPPFDATTPGNAVVALSSTAAGLCALRADGTVWCLGSNTEGELGPGIENQTSTSVPVQVPGITNATAIASGFYHTCVNGMGSTGAGIYCWGANNYGQLGNGTTSTTPVLNPVMVANISGEARSLAAGPYTTYAIHVLGSTFGWGLNDYGQLGIGTTTNQPTPTWVGGTLNPSLAVAPGFNHACFLGIDGRVGCAGDNSSGQLGDGTTTTRSTVVAIAGLTAKQITAGRDHSCSLSTAGLPQCWGRGEYGHVGDGTGLTRTAPSTVGGGTIVMTAISSGAFAEHTCGISTALDLYCWGVNTSGELGDGTNYAAYSPTKSILQ
jgi:alpha-tubulin suppressor-like RCC1 family protein